MQSPTEITDSETFWVRSRDVSDSPDVASEEYYDVHEVTRREHTTADDLPPTDSDAVRTLDRKALEQQKLIGKWQLTGSAEQIESLWPDVLADVEDGTLWAAKVMTQTGYDELPYEEYMIVVYTPNYFDIDDVTRVREHLRTAYDVTHELYYKPDIYTAEGIVAESAAEFGLSVPARYIS